LFFYSVNHQSVNHTIQHTENGVKQTYLVGWSLSGYTAEK